MIIDVRVLDMLTNLNVFIKPKKKKKQILMSRHIKFGLNQYNCARVEFDFMR